MLSALRRRAGRLVGRAALVPPGRGAREPDAGPARRPAAGRGRGRDRAPPSSESCPGGRLERSGGSRARRSSRGSPKRNEDPQARAGVGGRHAAARGRLEGLARRGRAARERPLRRPVAGGRAAGGELLPTRARGAVAVVRVRDPCRPEARPWEHYLHVGAESRVFGRVLLWGATVEGTHGWRAARARPVEIFVPTGGDGADRVSAGLRCPGARARAGRTGGARVNPLVPMVVEQTSRGERAVDIVLRGYSTTGS